MSPPQSRLWSVIKVMPEKWRQSPYGDTGGGFWVVAVLGELVLWYNDIEEGFNISRHKNFNEIKDYWCNQDELEWAVQALLNLIQDGYAPPTCSPPIVGEYGAGR